MSDFDHEAKEKEMQQQVAEASKLLMRLNNIRVTAQQLKRFRWITLKIVDRFIAEVKQDQQWVKDRIALSYKCRFKQNTPIEELREELERIQRNTPNADSKFIAEAFCMTVELMERRRALLKKSG